MRVLFSSTTGFGHVLPMVPLARAFVDAGHDVLWATGEEIHPLLVDADLPVAACGPTGQALAELQGAVLRLAAQLPGHERAAFVFPRMFGEAMAPPMAADLLPLARDWRPGLLVHEHAELASPVVGAVLGVPSVTHSFGGGQPAAFVAEAGDRLAPMWAEHGLEVPPYAGCFESLYLDICPASLQTVPLDHVTETQALRPAVVTPRDPADPPLVYVTLGTVQNLSLDLGPLVAAVAALPVDVLVAVGPDGDPAALGEQPVNVRVERWVDQPRVLEQASAVVSHAGSGTFLGVLAHGLPQLCLPRAADQFRNAEGGRRAGASLVLMPDEVTPVAVGEAVARLLGDAEIGAAAGRVATEIAAMPSPDDVVGLLVERYDA